MTSAPDLSAALLLNRVLSAFLAAGDVDRAIDAALGIVGLHFNVSRVYIFENAEDNLSASNTYEWVNEGIDSCKELLRNVSFSEIGDYYSFFDQDNLFVIPDINTLQGRLRDLLAVQGIRSMLQVAFVRNGRPFGMIGFDDCTGSREWSREEIAFLGVLARLIAVFVLNKHSESRSRQFRDLAFRCIEQMDAYIYVVDVETHNLLYFNEKLKELAPAVKLGEACYKHLLGQQNEPCSFCPVLAWRRDPGKVRSAFEFHNRRFDLWTNISSAVFEWFNGRRVCFMCCVDITAKRRYELKLEALAFTDELTGIANGRKYEQAGPDFVERARQQGSCLAVMTLQLQNLHRINSTRGHKRGDEILQAFAARISRVVPGTGFFARIRGNDFAIICPFDKDQGKGWVQSLLLRILDEEIALAPPSGSQSALGVRIGVSLFPEDGSTFEELSRNSVLAVPEPSSKEVCAFYDAKATAKASERERLARELPLAVAAGQLEVFHQPKYSTRASRIVGTEALVRWHHPELGLLTGGQFIPLAEELRLVSAIDDWVLEEACRQIRLLLDRGIPMVRVSVNFSPDKFYGDDVVERLQNVLARHRVPPEYLEIELTERLALEDIDKAADTMRRIRALGIKISIDDFGTGYSSLNYLRMFSFDAVKVDRTFAQDIESDPTAQGIVKAIVSLSRLLGAQVIFEGIETPAQYSMAVAAGCEIIQGYFTGAPVSLDELDTRLREQHDRPRVWRLAPEWKRRLGLLLCMGAVVVTVCLGLWFLESEHHGLLVHGLVVGGLALFAALSAGLATRYLRLKRSVDRALRTMIQACRATWRGESGATFPVQEEGRLGELAEVLQTTARKFRDSNDELREQGRNLEELNRELRGQHEKFRIVCGAVTGVVWELNLRTRIMQFSAGISVLYGYTQRFYRYPEELMQLIHPEDIDALRANLEAALLGDVKTFVMEMRLRKATGDLCWIRANGEVMYDDRGEPEYLLGTFVSLDGEGNSSAGGEHGGIDPLTGLMNRLTGEAALSRETEESGRQSSLALLDVDNLREIGRQFGHLCADSVLRELARRLKQFAGQDDVLFRCGTDMFALYKAGCDATRLDAFMEELLRVIRAPYAHHQMNMSVTCTAGVAVLTPPVKASEALDKVRAALGEAKIRGRGGFSVLEDIPPLPVSGKGSPGLSSGPE